MTRLALAYFVAVATFLLLVDFGMLRAVGDYVNIHAPLDKVLHFLLYGVLALLGNASLANQPRWSLMGAVATGSVIVLIASTLEEYSNLLVPNRTWSLGDLAANYLGVFCLGVMPFLVWRQKWAAE